MDAISGQDGTFDKVLEEMKQVPEFQVDLRKMMQSLGKRVSIVVKTAEPINESSEKMLVGVELSEGVDDQWLCLLYTSPSPRDRTRSRMPSSA